MPPAHLPALAAACRAVTDALVTELQSMAAGLTDGMTHDVAAERLRRAREEAHRFDQTRQALQRAEHSLRMNILGAHQRCELSDYRLGVETLEHTSIQVRSLARLLADTVSGGRPDWLDPAALGQPLAEFVLTAATCVEATRRDADDDFGARVSAAQSSRQNVLSRAREVRSLLAGDGWLRPGSIMVTLERLIGDLRTGVADEDEVTSD